MKKPKPKQLKEEPKPYHHRDHIGAVPKLSPKRAVNVSVDVEILDAARAQRINLSQTLEEVLRRLTQTARETQWRARMRRPGRSTIASSRNLGFGARNIAPGELR